MLSGKGKQVFCRILRGCEMHESESASNISGLCRQAAVQAFLFCWRKLHGLIKMIA